MKVNVTQPVLVDVSLAAITAVTLDVKEVVMTLVQPLVTLDV